MTCLNVLHKSEDMFCISLNVLNKPEWSVLHKSECSAQIRMFLTSLNVQFECSEQV